MLRKCTVFTNKGIVNSLNIVKKWFLNSLNIILVSQEMVLKLIKDIFSESRNTF